MSFIEEIRPDRELIPLEVEAWKKTIYYYPVCLADTDYATKMSKGSDAKFIVYMLVRKLLSEQGEQLLTVGNIPELMRNHDPDVLSQIVIDMKGPAEKYRANI